MSLTSQRHHDPSGEEISGSISMGSSEEKGWRQHRRRFKFKSQSYHHDLMWVTFKKPPLRAGLLSLFENEEMETKGSIKHPSHSVTWSHSILRLGMEWNLMALPPLLAALTTRPATSCLSAMTSICWTSDTHQTEPDAVPYPHPSPQKQMLSLSYLIARESRAMKSWNPPYLRNILGVWDADPCHWMASQQDDLSLKDIGLTRQRHPLGQRSLGSLRYLTLFSSSSCPATTPISSLGFDLGLH